MFFTIPYTAGLGNAAIFFRLRDPGNYWNWTTLAWDAAESADTKLFGTETASDSVDSNYSVTHAVPAGVFIIESMLASTGEVIGRDVTSLDSTILTESYAADGEAATLAQLLYEIRALLAEQSYAGTILTTKKLDGATVAATYTLTVDGNGKATGITRTS